jgi:hypothetical protein
VSAEALLDRLECVRATGPGRWVARCPSHADRSPSLSLREVDDGRLLLHCFAGCGTDEVLAVLGLKLRDLFPNRLPGIGEVHSYPQSHSRIPARDLLEILDHEVTIAALIAADILADRTVSEEQWARLAIAVGRIGKARDHGRA